MAFQRPLDGLDTAYEAYLGSAELVPAPFQAPDAICGPFDGDKLANVFFEIESQVELATESGLPIDQLAHWAFTGLMAARTRLRLYGTPQDRDARDAAKQLESSLVEPHFQEIVIAGLGDGVIRLPHVDFALELIRSRRPSSRDLAGKLLHRVICHNRHELGIGHFEHISADSPRVPTLGMAALMLHASPQAPARVKQDRRNRLFRFAAAERTR